MKKTASFSFTDIGWRCWGACKEYGDLATLCSLYYNIPIEEAREKYKTIAKMPAKKKPIQQIKERRYDLHEALLNFPLAIEQITSKYISSEVIEKYNIRFVNKLCFNSHKSDKDYTIHNRIVFPIYRGHTLQAVTSRVLFTAPDTGDKYRFSPFACQKGNCLYGMEHIVPGETLYVVEGVMDVLSFAMKNKNAVGLLGCSVTIQQYDMLLYIVSLYDIPQIRIIFDGDEAGRNAAIRTEKLFQSNDLIGDYVIGVCIDGDDPYSIYVKQNLGIIDDEEKDDESN